MQLKIYFVLTIVSFNLMHTIQKCSLHFNSALITLRNYPWIFFSFFCFFKKILVIFISSCNYEFCTNIKKKNPIFTDYTLMHYSFVRAAIEKEIQVQSKNLQTRFVQYLQKKGEGKEKKIASSRKSNQLEISSKTPSNSFECFPSSQNWLEKYLKFKWKGQSRPSSRVA